MEHELSRINKDVEVNLFRKVISDLAPYFEISLGDFYANCDQSSDSYNIFKQFTKLLSQRLSILKDKLNVLL